MDYFGRARQAKEITDNATNEEIEKIAGYENTIDDVIGNSREQIMVDKVQYEQLVSDVAKLKNQNEYSTNEQVIGKSIDGKPLYRRCFYRNNWTIGDVNLGLSNIDTVYKLVAEVKDSNNSYSVPYYDNGYYLTLYYNIESDLLHLAGSFNTVNKAIIIIEYTKTTDTVGT